MNHLIDILQLSTQEIDELVAKANNIIARPEAYAHKCDGKILATLFFEPSTRTRLSFESAMLSLGGKVLGFSSASSSSASKGESVSDTIRTVSCYSDIIAMRHPKEGAPLVASMHSEVPVINAGDGGHNHPTQTLTDLLTIQREKGRFNDLTVGFCGDLKFGRTVHSLISALSRYTGIKIVLISPEELKLPSYVKNEALKKHNIPYEQTTDLEAVMPRWLGKFLVWILTRLDIHGWIPASIIETDPYYTTCVISNLGSIKLNCGYHHLTNWGTCSVFCIIGEKSKRPVYHEDGTIEMREMLDLGLTIDERLADGYYYSKTIRLLKTLLENPELLETPANQEVAY